MSDLECVMSMIFVALVSICLIVGAKLDNLERRVKALEEKGEDR